MTRIHHRRQLRRALGVSLVLVAACGGGNKNKGPVGPAIGEDGTNDEGEKVGAVGDAVFPDEPFRAQAPEVGGPRDFKLPEINRFQIGDRDKIDVFLIERHELPTISIDLNFEGGGVVDPASKAGAASVCMEMLSEGTQALDKIAFNEALADVASSVGSYAGDDTQGVSMQTLTKNFDATFPLFVDTLTKPGLRKADLDRMIKRRLESLKQSRGSAASVAGRLNGVVVYGGTHPLGRVTTEKSLKAINLNDCKRHHQAYIKPRGARLFVVGDVTKEQVEKSFAPLLVAWKGAPRKVARPQNPRPPRGRVFFVNIPGAAQSSVGMVHVGPQRKAADYFPTMLLAQVLGGGFASRINMNLREDKGYSYGARGGFAYNRHFGTFTARSSVRSDATLQSLLEMVKEVRGLKDGSKPPSQTELQRDQEGTILGLPAAFSTAEAALGQYRTLVYFGLPADYYNTYIDQVKAVNAEQIQAAATSHLRPDEARFLIVGDGDAPQIVHQAGEGGAKGTDSPMVDGSGQPVTLRAALAKLVADGTLGKGELVVLNPDGLPVKQPRTRATAKPTGGAKPADAPKAGETVPADAAKPTDAAKPVQK